MNITFPNQCLVTKLPCLSWIVYFSLSCFICYSKSCCLDKVSFRSLGRLLSFWPQEYCLDPIRGLQISFLKKINLFILFIYFWLCLVFVAACGLSLVAESGGYSSLRCMGFPLRWLLLLQSTGSRHEGSVVVARGLSLCVSLALEHRLSSCGARAQLLRGMWDLPRPGLEPVSPALAGGFLTAAP